MFLYFTFFLHILIFQVVNSQSSNSSQNFLTLEFPYGPEESLNRTRREDRLKHQAICKELDRTEDTPFVVVIITKNRGRLLCMGSIIDEYHVLTAKNCLEKTDAATLMVIAGYQSPYFGRNSQVKFAEKINKNERDLAIIKLQKPFTVTTTVKPVRIIGPGKLNKTMKKDTYPLPYAIFGFQVPKTLEHTDYLPKPSAYQMIDEVFDGDNCTKCYKEHAADDQYLFCSDGRADFIWGGVGSPVVIILEKQFIQIGVLIKGKCSEEKYEESKSRKSGKIKRQDSEKKKRKIPPNLHIRTDKFYNWIKANSYVGREREN